MSQFIEPRVGWGKKLYRFLQRPAVFLPLIWLVVLLSWYANYREPDIASYVIAHAHHR